MALPINIFGARKGNTDASQVAVQLDLASGSLLTSKGAQDLTETSRAGLIWNVTSAASTPLVVIPTTLTILEVYNNIQGSMLEILDLFCFHLLGTAVLHSPSLWGQVTSPKAAPSTGSLVIGSQSGRLKYTDTASTAVTTGAGTTVVANGWRPFGTQSPGVVATATPAEAWNAPVNGALTVPYGCSVCVTVTDTVATASSVQVGLSWAHRLSVVTVA